jgi:hypothetical protein
VPDISNPEARHSGVSVRIALAGSPPTGGYRRRAAMTRLAGPVFQPDFAALQALSSIASLSSITTPDDAKAWTTSSAGGGAGIETTLQRAACGASGLARSQRLQSSTSTNAWPRSEARQGSAANAGSPRRSPAETPPPRIKQQEPGQELVTKAQAEQLLHAPFTRRSKANAIASLGALVGCGLRTRRSRGS